MWPALYDNVINVYWFLTFIFYNTDSNEIQYIGILDFILYFKLLPAYDL